MKPLRAIIACGFATGLRAWAVYAPIPEQDQGKAWTFSATGGVSYDSNIFAAASHEIGSTIFTVAPKVSFNASITSQTFASASYELTLDHFDNRPGKKTLDSHALAARLAHAFTSATSIDVSDVFTVQRNPASDLAGVSVNTNQSFKNNEVDGSATTAVNAKAGITVKVRSLLYRYDNPTLATSLDRTENLYGLSGDYAVLPDTKAVVEYRHQDIDYRRAGGSKDKRSDFLMGGADYDVAQKITASGRVGFEHRTRESQSDETVPYVELSARYAYAQGSFLSAGYVYTLEETSNVALYTDTKVNRLFANVQHAVTALIVASASADYEPSRLQGRRGNKDADETTSRLGLALSYLPTKNWTLSASYDYDNVTSDDRSREYTRNRVGATARYTF